MKIRVVIVALVVIFIGIVIFFYLNINFGLYNLVNSIKAENYECEISNKESSQFAFPVRPQTIKVEEIYISVYEFGSFGQCSDFSKKISYSGFTINGMMISWADIPHFYKKGRIIVKYMGTDSKMLRMLESILGKQFAGL